MMQEKHRYLERHYTGKYRKDECDEFLEREAGDMKKVKSFLTDWDLTEFVPVTIPEPLCIEETERFIEILKDQKIPVRNIVVNQAMREGDCPFCRLRRKDREKFLKEIEKKFADYQLIKVPLFPHQIQGIEDLKKFADILFGEPCQFKPARPIAKEAKVSPIAPSRMSDLLKKDLTLILFGGKGGVGKTSMSAATSLHLAKLYPQKKVLCFSTDPAHSLADSFWQEIGDKVTSIKGAKNLYAIEIDAPKLLEDWKEEYRETIEEVYGEFISGHISVKFDKEVLDELFELSPPGLDELMALRKITDFIEMEEFDLYILDSAATGHLIRFLELPSILREWLKAIFQMLLKYKGIMRLNILAEKTIELSRDVRRIKEVLTNPERSEFVCVTLPEAMVIAQTERLLDSLKKLETSCNHLIVNMVIPPKKCSFCESKRKEQQKYIDQINKKFSQYSITQVPLFPYEIHGIETLEELSKILYGK